MSFRLGATVVECLAGKTVGKTPTATGPSCPFCNTSLTETAKQPYQTCPVCKEWLLAIPPHDRAGHPRYVPAFYDKYLVMRLVAQGGMGVVFEGRDESNNPVAIKLVSPFRELEPAALERFKREAIAMRHVSHPNVVAMLAEGDIKGFHYLVMEWVEGTNLRDLISQYRRAQEPPSFATVKPLFEQACLGLGAIHAAGVCHRDIKPSNMLLDSQGRLVISDFGVAVQRDRPTDLTTTGELPGTWEYMAPERWSGADGMDVRSDLYSLGATFYELLTLERPIGHWPLPSTVNPTVPAGMDEIIKTMLAHDPKARLGSAEEVVFALALTATGTGTTTAPLAEQPTKPTDAFVLLPYRADYWLTLLGAAIITWLISASVSIVFVFSVAYGIYRTRLWQRAATNINRYILLVAGARVYENIMAGATVCTLAVLVGRYVFDELLILVVPATAYWVYRVFYVIWKDIEALPWDKASYIDGLPRRTKSEEPITCAATDYDELARQQQWFLWQLRWLVPGSIVLFAIVALLSPLIGWLGPAGLGFPLWLAYVVRLVIVGFVAGCSIFAFWCWNSWLWDATVSFYFAESAFRTAWRRLLVEQEPLIRRLFFCELFIIAAFTILSLTPFGGTFGRIAIISLAIACIVLVQPGVAAIRQLFIRRDEIATDLAIPEWRVNDNGKRTEPISTYQLRQMAMSGAIKQFDEVQRTYFPRLPI